MWASSIGGWGWDIHFEAGAAAGHARRAGQAAVQMCDGSDECETEAAATLGGSSAGLIDAIERLEQMGQIFGGDAGPGVLDRKPESRSRGNGLKLHADFAADRRELHRILEQMIDQSLDQRDVHEQGGLDRGGGAPPRRGGE